MMSEELIPKEENLEVTAAPTEKAEPMGTVIAMDSVKPVVPEFVKPLNAETPDKPSGSDQPVSPAGSSDSNAAGKDTSETPPAYNTQSGPVSEEPNHETNFDKEKGRIRDFFHFKNDLEDFSKEDWILSRIPEENLMEYLTLEHKKTEMLQEAKEKKEKRIFMSLQLTVSLAAIVGVVALLKDNPTVLVNILYITGIVIALWIWRGKQDK